MIKSIGKVYLCFLLVERWLNSCCVSYWWSNPLIYHLLNTDYPNGIKGIIMHNAETTYPSRDLNIVCQHNKWYSIIIRNQELSIKKTNYHRKPVEVLLLHCNALNDSSLRYFMLVSCYKGGQATLRHDANWQSLNLKKLQQRSNQKEKKKNIYISLI